MRFETLKGRTLTRRCVCNLSTYPLRKEVAGHLPTRRRELSLLALSQPSVSSISHAALSYYVRGKPQIPVCSRSPVANFPTVSGLNSRRQVASNYQFNPHYMGMMMPLLLLLLCHPASFDLCRSFGAIGSGGEFEALILHQFCHGSSSGAQQFIHP